MFKTYSFPEKYQEKIERALNSLNFSLSRPKELVERILALADHYQQKEKITPWNIKGTQAAYLAYYFPLNYIRNLKVLDELNAWPAKKAPERLLDFGFGLGSGYLAACDSGLLNANTKVIALDSAKIPLQLFEKYLNEGTHSIEYASDVAKGDHFDWGLFSYVLNELPTPAVLERISNLVLIEPSTQYIGRHLMARRQELLDKGYQMLAPCTHQQRCPQLIGSKTDWCHDRVHWTMPEWWLALEKALPIKNQTLTFSYLIASKDLAPLNVYTGRVVGDELVEKGKSRWLYCRNEEREYLSWLKKSGEAPVLHRGELLNVKNFEKKGNELRLNLRPS